MDQQQLSNRLEDRVADVPVGAPPIDAMRSAVRRRRSRMTVLGAAAAVAVIAAGGVAWQQVDNADPRPPIASDQPADPDAPPEGYRYVGIGSAVIAVPETWGSNETECGTPQEDTVVIDQGFICQALIPRPADVDSVRVEPILDGRPIGEVTTVGGVTSGSVDVPGQGVRFIAESSSADGKAVVEELLASVTTLKDHVTVPGFQDSMLDKDAYVADLEGLGLSVEIVTENSGLERGTVLSADPAVGSVVSPGDTVTVTVAR
jgi:hypothetical protein